MKRSLQGEFDEKEIYPYVTEGIGEDILPLNVNFGVIDGFTKVTDKDGAVYTQRLAKEEGPKRADFKVSIEGFIASLSSVRLIHIMACKLS